MKKLAAVLGLALAIAVGGVAVEGTPFATSTPKAEAASYTSCYTSMAGDLWCWRYGCNYFERMYLQCNAWVIVNRTWYA